MCFSTQDTTEGSVSWVIKRKRSFKYVLIEDFNLFHCLLDDGCIGFVLPEYEKVTNIIKYKIYMSKY